MRASILMAIIAVVMWTGSPASAADSSPKRLKRADSFLGIHYDFHAGPDCTEIGKNTTPEMVASIIDQAVRR